MSADLNNEIVSRWRNGQSLRGIARQLKVSRKRVTRLVRLHSESRDAPTGPADLPAPPASRKSRLDPFQEQIEQLLSRYPNITVTRLLEELRQAGYEGGYSILRERVKGLRKKPTRPLVERFETSPGAQAQMDWAVYDIDFSGEGRRRVNLFSYVLGYSRRQYVHFTESQDFDHTVRQHICAFEHLGGAAATCLYDNMKVVVGRWEGDHPIYNARFLAFATHYGFRPWACRIRRPQTKGKVERPFHYVETSLLNGRTFRSLEHLNEVTRWWLANKADVRVHRHTKKRPVDAHAEELPHLLPLPEHHYDAARVVYRVVDAEGMIAYGQNQYSAPWRLVGEVLPIRVTEQELLIYDRRIEQIGRHLLLRGKTGERQVDPAHRPPKQDPGKIELLRQRFAELGEVAAQFLEGLLKKQRCGQHQGWRVLALLRTYRRDDGLAALERAVRYHAYSFSSVERILAAQARPHPPWQTLSEGQEEVLGKFSGDSTPPRSSEDYQYLLFEDDDDERPAPEQRRSPPKTDRPVSGDAEDPDDGRPT